MRSATVVIGAAFGDEGKGLMTDYYATHLGGPAVIVCRFNGGAQAGHTVQTPFGSRHVFGHFGSGTLAGAATYLSPYFIVNPLLWAKELRQLEPLLAQQPILFVDRHAKLSTPFDMLINQIAESARSGNRHGSCGVGINETVVRCELPTYATTAEDLLRPDLLRLKLQQVLAEYVPDRLDTLELTDADSETMDLLSKPGFLVDQYLSVVERMALGVVICDAAVLRRRPVVFEGAQGLLLDEQHRFFPYVTRSKTGIRNVVEIAKAIDIEELNVTYAFRTYMTRHGAGPFPTEDIDLTYEDSTNVPHLWQGTLRFGHLDLDLIREAVHADYIEALQRIAINPTIAVTHCDQVDWNSVRYRLGGRDHNHPLLTMVEEAMSACSIDDVMLSFGPTRNALARGLAPLRRRA